MDDEAARAPRLLVIAHGTASVAGAATTARLVAGVAAQRGGVAVDLCFLDVASPRLPDALGRHADRPTIAVPLLLSTGYHIQTDIPVTAAGQSNVRVARHLGPHPLLVDALVERLPPGRTASTVLVGAGSTRSDATAELAATAALLAERLGGSVATATVGPELRGRLETLPRPLRIATYLLAEGRFLTSLRAAADGLGRVAAPLGTHPALVELIWQRYDEVQGTR